ncbi:MAG: helix-turn-helix transcriptional regulator [Clostridia bacterium]|nr:helix-turn-helix transcriptional regulator [Clostridia bacterium]
MYNDHQDKLKQVTERIRYLRDILDLSQTEVADKLGIPVSLYIEYENGEKDIPISMMYGVADILGVDAAEILTGEAPKMLDYTVTRNGKGIGIDRYAGYYFEALAHNFINKNKEPMLVTIELSEKAPELVSHGGQEFNYVLEGKIGVILGKKTVELNTGDCIYFDPNIPHGQFAIGGTAKFLTVIDAEN